MDYYCVMVTFLVVGGSIMEFYCELSSNSVVVASSVMVVPCLIVGSVIVEYYATEIA